MLNELFITYNESSLFCELLSNYTRATDRQLIRVLKIKETTLKTLNISKLPLLITSLGETIADDVLISKFISNLTGTNELLFGKTHKENESNLSFINNFNLSKSKIDFLNNHLIFNSFCNGIHITISDIFAFSYIIFELITYDDLKKDLYSNVFRWALHIQSLKGIKDQVERLKIVLAPPSEKLFINFNEKTSQKHEKKEKKEVKELEPEKQKEIESKIKEAKEKKENQKKEEKPKKEEKKKEEKPKKKEEDEKHPISRVDIRVGRIISIHENTKSEKLYNEEIDIGNGEIRKIASGLKNKIPIEKLKDSLVVVLCNLKERNLCDWPSHGMLLCCNKGENNIDIIHPPEGSKPGDKISIGTYERTPDDVLNPKKNPWDLVKDKIKINNKGLAVYFEENNEYEWRTEKGNVFNSCLLDSIIS